MKGSVSLDPLPKFDYRLGIGLMLAVFAVTFIYIIKTFLFH